MTPYLRFFLNDTEHKILDFSSERVDIYRGKNRLYGGTVPEKIMKIICSVILVGFINVQNKQSLGERPNMTNDH